MTLEKQILTVPEELAGLRLDQALARMFPEYSRSRLKEWLLDGAISIDGSAKRPRDAVIGGEVVELTPVADAVVEAVAEPMELDLVFEDDDLLVVNKPAGLVVHPGAGNPAGTLMNGLLHHAPRLEEVPRAGIVHRIDKDTSGLLLVAKTLTAHTALVRLLADRQISRHYLAVCNGVLTGGGTIDAPIARHPVDRKRMSVQDRGKPAVTHYTVLQRFRAFTYVSATLDTGRTHQIRVHFAWRRHALLGDPVYGGRLALPAGASDALIDMLRSFRRQALHATRLALVHPVTGHRLELEVPPPNDFQALLEVLREDLQ
ncbi:MAG: 23S rRNA pseudouridine(1911/1915/1917) synthase RluD [Gammaproteobacteria bacterium]|nr:23S rRNA pseudouridine(1911/1915/1917) synthase RluD [Gammaproteobacteria bacterium]